jgi:hypothetical protein
MSDRRRAIRYSLVALALCLLALLVWFGIAAWRSAYGNYTFTFYGRIVDEKGQGIQGATVKLKLLYSDGIALPVMYGRQQRIRELTAITANDGSYRFGPLTGYAVSIIGVKKPGVRLVDTPPPYPRSSWSLDDPYSRAELPTSPQRPVVYVFKVAADETGK